MTLRLIVVSLRTGKEKGIVITCYSPLGNNITGKPRVINSPQVQEIAKRLNKDPAQVLIAWGAHQGFCVIPKSVTPSRIAVCIPVDSLLVSFNFLQKLQVW